MHFLAFALLAVASVTAMQIDQEESASTSTAETVCEPGKRFNEYCNLCACSHDGKSKVCTQMMCPPNVFNEDGSLRFVDPNSVKICEPNSLFKDDCNDCYCSGDGLRASCTFKLCLPRIMTDNKLLRVSESPKTCEPNTIFRNDCNECTCSDDGRTTDCTVRLCLPAYMRNSSSPTIEGLSTVCQPGKFFEDQCNECKCSDDGTRALCTLKYCPAETDERLKRQVIFQRIGQFCTPGVQFVRGCQLCICGYNGIQCNIGYCPPTIHWFPVQRYPVAIPLPPVGYPIPVVGLPLPPVGIRYPVVAFPLTGV